MQRILTAGLRGTGLTSRIAGVPLGMGSPSWGESYPISGSAVGFVLPVDANGFAELTLNFPSAVAAGFGVAWQAASAAARCVMAARLLETRSNVDGLRRNVVTERTRFVDILVAKTLSEKRECAEECPHSSITTPPGRQIGRPAHPTGYGVGPPPSFGDSPMGAQPNEHAAVTLDLPMQQSRPIVKELAGPAAVVQTPFAAG